MEARDAASADVPYPGLRPFHADETHLFFGRDAQRIELLQRLRRARFLAIVGTSGSGKSSLVRAGLLPGLHGGLMAGSSDRWRIADLRPGTDAIGNLARALDATGVLRDTPRPDDEPSFTEATLRRSGLGLIDAAREARLAEGEKLLVLVDQFEELFRALAATDRAAAGDDANAFVRLLLEAAKQPGLPIFVVLTMRSDFLGECARFRDLPEAINNGQYLVPRLTPDQRAEAITGPAAVFGVRLASTLVNRLLNDVGENPDQLPILQHALMRSWEAWSRRTGGPGVDGTGWAGGEIALTDYDSIGGMANALSRHADAVFDALAGACDEVRAAQRRLIADRLFKCLAAMGAGGLAIRRFASLQEVVDVSGAPANEVIAVIDAFRAPGQSFLMPPPHEALTPSRNIDISHESLIRNWPRMTAWADEEAESARVYDRLSNTALLHARGEAALWDQPDLGVALKWRDLQRPNAAWARRYNAVFGQAMEFLEASQKRAEAKEDAKGRRRRAWVFGVSLVFFVMLTGTLLWVREEVRRVDATTSASRAAKVKLDDVRALIDRRRLPLGSPAAQAAAIEADKVCKQGYGGEKWASGGMGAHPWEEPLGKLCANPGGLTADDRRQVETYGFVVDGRWVEARQAIGQSPGNADMRFAYRLLDELATMRPPSSRAERELLITLQDRATYPDRKPLNDAQRAQAAKLFHPVHRHIAEALLSPDQTLATQETLLLNVYRELLLSRDVNPAGNRDQAAKLVSELRDKPDTNLYGEVANMALTPDSKLADAVETLVLLVRRNVWSVGVLISWPLWRLWRIFQRHRGNVIRSTPNPARRVMAAVADVALAIGIGLLTRVVIEALVSIAMLLVGWNGEASRLERGLPWSLAVGTPAGVAYLLCRDALRLRYRRSIGKAWFDLRPLVTGAAADPGAMTLRRSIWRNGLPLLPAGVTALWFGLLLTIPEPTRLPVFIAWIPAYVAAGLMLADFGRGWFRAGETFSDKWSKTRLVDSDSAKSQAVRP